MDKPLVSFDYAIKYLLRDKKDYTIVEGFISALLKTIGYSDVKILSQLESESNQEDKKDKRSLADLIVQDTNNQKYIVEIERNLQPLFIHKSCFNTSRLLIDTISQGQDYSQILKIFHISLLYFPDGYIPGTVYHGKTLIQEVKSKEKLTFHITDPATNRVYDAVDILPEYFYISVPSFDDKLEEEFDEWLYVMKHDDIPQPHKSRYMDLIAERLNFLKMSEAEKNEYFLHLKKLYADRDQLQAATQKGKEEGLAIGRKEEGRKEEKIEIVRSMLQDKEPMEKIIKWTGLSKEELEEMIKLG